MVHDLLVVGRVRDMMMMMKERNCACMCMFVCVCMRQRERERERERERRFHVSSGWISDECFKWLCCIPDTRARTTEKKSTKVFFFHLKKLRILVERKFSNRREDAADTNQKFFLALASPA